MPSGPKKRKAARRKKLLGENNNKNKNNKNVSQLSTSDSAVNSQYHDTEDLKHGGHKEIDVGEVGSAASQDHQFNDREGTGKKQLEISHSESSVDKSKSNALKKGSNEAKKVAIEGGDTVEGESMSHNSNVERVEPLRFPHEGGLRRRSSSNSKPAMSEDTIQVATSASDIDIVALHSIGSSEKENEKRELDIMDEKTRDNKAVATSDTKISVALKDDDKLDLSYDAPAVDVGVHADDINSFPGDKNKSNSLKKGSNEANKVAIEKEGSMSHNSNIERVEPSRFPHEGGLRRRSSSSSSKPAMSEDIVQVATSSSDIDTVTLHSIGSSDKENEKRILDALVTSNAKPFVAVKDNDKLELSYNAPAVDAGVHADDMKSSPPDHQTPVALVPRPAQTTSWKSCCGLFEVFAGSNK